MRHDGMNRGQTGTQSLTELHELLAYVKRLEKRIEQLERRADNAMFP